METTLWEMEILKLAEVKQSFQVDSENDKSKTEIKDHRYTLLPFLTTGL